MTYVQSAAKPAPLFVQAGAAALFVLFLTSVHHIYGAVIYDTPWRLHIVFVAVPFALVIAGMLAFGWVGGNSTWARYATWTAAIAILVFPVAMIGVYEGGYNHVVKNFIYFVLGDHVARGMCPEAVCELPNDFIFEATGVAQFVAAIPAAVLAFRLIRERGR